MEDANLSANNSTSSDPPHLQTTDTNNEPQNLPSVRVNHENRQDSVPINTQLIREIKALQQRLSELERQARPSLDREALEAEWGRARDELGPTEERKTWSEQMRRRRSELAGIPLSDVKAQHVYEGDFDQMLNLLNLRKKWERKVDSVLGVDRYGNDSDSDTMDEEAAGEVAKFRLKIARRAFRLEEDDIRRTFQAKQAIRERRNDEAQREQKAVSEHEDKKGQEQKTDENIIPDALSQVDRVSWPQFQSLRGVNEASSSAMDVLVGEPAIEFNIMPHLKRLQAYGRKGKVTTEAQDRRATPKLDTAPEQTPIPERLRINSRHLLRILSELARPNNPLFDSPIVLLRPFRILAYFDEAIRDQYKRLDNSSKKVHHEKLSTSCSATLTSRPGSIAVKESTDQEKSFGSESPSEGEAAKGNRSDSKDAEKDEGETNGLDTESPVAFEHLGCLIDFIDSDMEKRMSYLRSNNCRKVFFSDLWFLFQPGGLVIRNDGKQAYRVLTMNSIGHRVIDPFRKYYRESREKKDEGEKEEEEASITIKCVHIDFDGKQLGPVSKVFRIPRFEREIAVTSLQVYPLRFHPFKKEDTANDTIAPGTEFKKHLINRGRRFLKVTAVHQATVQPMYYAGPALQTQDEIESQVVVDFEAGFAVDDNDDKGWKPKLETLIQSGDSNKKESDRQKCDADCCRGEYVHDDSYIEKKMNDEFMGSLLPKTREETPSVVLVPRPLDTKAPEAALSEDDLVIISYRVFGYVLRNRKWAQLDLTYLTEVQPSGAEDRDANSKGQGTTEAVTAFDQLVLPPGHKNMIMSLITQHFREKEALYDERTDIIRGKGKGLIILLHGAPGVGKTTTAEGVAERFKKPLFQLTCGDLGTTAKEVESTLETNFALASRWGCILLLDEADVFLAQRTKEDFKRNGLVAVFLRVLEYYAGILFLTTNRVGDFDEAFASRIHISLYYPELGSKETLEVFKLNLRLVQDRFKSKDRKIIVDDAGISVFVIDYWNHHPFDHWNGRQIRNACQTAVALAEFEASDENDTSSITADVHLEVSHFETVAKAYLAFSEHMKNIYGTHTARRAKEAGLRAMWVNEKGDLIGNIGPKETSILKKDRKSRYKQRSAGQFVTNTHEQQQQLTISAGQDMMSYRGGGGGGQGFMNQPLPTRQPPPMGAPEHYNDRPMPQQPSYPNIQSQPQRIRPQYSQGQNLDGYHSGYDSPQPPAGEPRGPYIQGRSHFEANNPSQVKGGASQTQRPSAGGYAPAYHGHGPEYEAEGAQYRDY
ncbi:hypothetical protein F4802DRAFT_580379 [Xylaria palmicola]|nr:hypothetical protein F4802DRAFT_580379 [Xylaria palmicola]